MQDTARLLDIASEALVSAAPVVNERAVQALCSSLGQELWSLLLRRNGFYAFESALLVRPLEFKGSPLGIVEWNRPDTWRRDYQTDLGDALFFAEDIFGVQFCVRHEQVDSFEPETGEFKNVARSIEGWCGWLLEDFNVRSGWPLAHSWQVTNGPLRAGMRLLPKVPFVLGGEFVLDNLYELDDVEGMRFRADIANQIRDCPDGTSVVLKIKRPGVSD